MKYLAPILLICATLIAQDAPIPIQGSGHRTAIDNDSPYNMPVAFIDGKLVELIVYPGGLVDLVVGGKVVLSGTGTIRLQAWMQTTDLIPPDGPPKETVPTGGVMNMNKADKGR